MSKGSDAIALMSDETLRGFYEDILEFEKEKTLSEDSRIRIFINENYGGNDAYFLIMYTGFSQELLFEICKRHYKKEDEKSSGNRTVKIAGHIVEYWYRNDDEYIDGICLPEADEEHIKNMIIDGYREGEICSFLQDEEKEEYGWWKIVK